MGGQRFWMSIAAMMAPLTAQAQAQDARDLCADRPGIGTPACTIDRGRVAMEIGAGDWTHDRDGISVTDTIELGQALLRYGVTDRLEVQLGWTAYGHVRTKDRTTGAVDRASGTGDVTLALRQNLRNPDGSGFALAVMPYVTLPTGGSAIGAGDWGAGVILPSSFDLGHGLSLEAVGEVDAAVDGDGKGRHLAYGGVVGLGLDLGDSLSGTVELAATRDEDPDGHATEALAGLSLGWQADEDMQFDVGMNIGLNRNSADRELYLGVVRRF